MRGATPTIAKSRTSSTRGDLARSGPAAHASAAIEPPTARATSAALSEKVSKPAACASLKPLSSSPNAVFSQLAIDGAHGHALGAESRAERLAREVRTAAAIPSGLQPYPRCHTEDSAPRDDVHTRRAGCMPSRLSALRLSWQQLISLPSLPAGATPPVGALGISPVQSETSDTTPRAASAPQVRPPVCVDLRPQRCPTIPGSTMLPGSQHPGSLHPRPWSSLDAPQSSLLVRPGEVASERATLARQTLAALELYLDLPMAQHKAGAGGSAEGGAAAQHKGSRTDLKGSRGELLSCRGVTELFESEAEALRRRLLSGDHPGAHPAARQQHAAAVAAATSFATAAAASAGFRSISIAEEHSAGYHPRSGWGGLTTAASASAPLLLHPTGGLRTAATAGMRRNAGAFGSDASLSSLTSWPEASAPPTREGSPLPVPAAGSSISSYEIGRRSEMEMEIGCVEGLLSLGVFR